MDPVLDHETKVGVPVLQVFAERRGQALLVERGRAQVERQRPHPFDRAGQRGERLLYPFVHIALTQLRQRLPNHLQAQSCRRQ